MSTIDEVLSEVLRAVQKFPTWPTDPLHALAVLGEEFGELNKAMLQLTYEPSKSTAEDVRMEAIQTAAMALRLLASLETYVYLPSPQHAQAISPVPARDRQVTNAERPGAVSKLSEARAALEDAINLLEASGCHNGNIEPLRAVLSRGES